MDQFVIVSGGAVVFGPTGWNRDALAHALGALDWTVSLGTGPEIWRSPVIGDDERPAAAILPCSVTGANPPRTHALGDRADQIGVDSVAVAYAWVQRDVAVVRADLVATDKAVAGRLIDAVLPRWLVDRAVSGGEPIPDAVKAAAAAIRAASNAREAWIAAAVERLADLDGIPSWPEAS